MQDNRRGTMGGLSKSEITLSSLLIGTSDEVEEENGDSDSEGVCYLLGDTLCPVRKMEQAAVESRTRGSPDKDR
jgi:hypothetical protein